MAAPASAQVVLPCFWTGGGGNWESVGKWVPEPLDINNLFLFWPDNKLSSNFFVPTISGATVTLNTPISVSSLIVGSSGSLRISGGMLDVEGIFGIGGVLENSGDIELSSGGTLDVFTITGDGEIELAHDDAAIGGLVVHDSGHTLRGYGTIGDLFSLDALVNSGVIRADREGRTLRIDGIALENEGLLHATGGGRIKIEPLLLTNDDTIDADGGDIDIETQEFENDGLVRARNGGRVFIDGGEVRNSGSLFDIQANSSLHLDGVIFERGTIRTVATGGVHLHAGANRFEAPMDLAGNFFITGGNQIYRNGVFDTRLAVTSVAPGVPVSMQNATFTGGVFTGGGLIRVETPGTLDATETLTLDDLDIYLPGSRSLTLRGDLLMHNGSVITIEDHAVGLGTGDAEMQIDGEAVIGGDGGAIRFGHTTHSSHINAIRPVNGGHLTLGENIRIEAPGVANIGYIELPLTNHGTVEANGGLVYLNNNSIVSDGSLSATDGGTLYLSRGLNIDNTGGHITAGAGSIIRSSEWGGGQSPVTITGGTLDGGGTFFNGFRTVLDSSVSTIRTQDVLISIPGNTILTLKGELDHHADIHIEDNALGFGTIDAILRLDGDVALNGAGSVTFGPQHHQANNNVIDTENGGSLTIGPGIAIRTGANGWGTLAAPLVNHGRISADTGNLFFPSTSLVNRGLLEARNGGKVWFSQSAAIDNAGGTLRSGGGSTVDLRTGSSITGGLLDGGGLFELTGNVAFHSSAHPITLRDSTVQVNASSAFLLTGSLTLDQAALFLRDAQFATGTPARLRASGDASITGAGEIRFPFATNNQTQEQIIDAPGGSTFTFGPGITLRVEPQAGGYLDGVITSHGTILAEGGRLFVSTEKLTNTGTISSDQGGGIDIGRGFDPVALDNTGGGTLHAGADSWMLLSTGFGATTVKGGSLTGPGEFRIGAVNIFDGRTQPVSLSSTLRIANSTSLTLQGELAMQNGLLTMRDGIFALGTHARLRASGDAALTGTGEIRFLPGNGSQDENIIDTPGGSTLTFGPGITLRVEPGGSGFLEGSITSHGTILADGGRLFVGTEILTNTGTMRAEQGGGIEIGRGSLPVALDNTGATLHAGTGSWFLFPTGFGATTVKGGSLTGAGEFRIGPAAVFDGRAQPVALHSTVRLTNRTALTIQGELALENALITMRDGEHALGTHARLRASGDASLTGTGEIRFLPGNASQDENYIEAPGGSTFTFGSGITLRAEPGGGGFIEAPLTTAGRIHNDSLIYVAQPVTVLAAGTLAGRGTFSAYGAGAWTNHGSISPGDTTGILTFNGPGLHNSATSKILIDIGGTTPGTGHDRVSVNTTLHLGGGTLLVSLIDGFIPEPEDTFTIVTASTITGQFSNAPHGSRVFTAGGSGSFRLEQTGSAIRLTAFAVEEITYDSWAQSHGLSGDDADWFEDLDGDGWPNLLEYAFGGHPREPDAKGTAISKTEADGQRYLTLTYTRPSGPAGRNDLTYTPERAPGLAAAPDWNAAHAVHHHTEPGPGDTEAVTVRSVFPMTAQDREFLRLRVTLNSP